METITNIPTNLWKACVLLFSKRVFYFLGAFPPVCCSPGYCTGSSYSWGTILCQKCWCHCTSTLCFACPHEAGSQWTSELTSRGHISQFVWYLKIHKQYFCCSFLLFQLQSSQLYMLLCFSHPSYYWNVIIFVSEIIHAATVLLVSSKIVWLNPHADKTE